MKKHTEKPSILDWLGASDAPNRRLARPLGPVVGFALALLIAGAYIAALGTVYLVLFSDGGSNTSNGALIAAILGAPFVVWATVIRHQSLRFQKEGHITDRITAAVEQLGAQKSVNRIGRPVTVWVGEPSISYVGGKNAIDTIKEQKSEIISSEWKTSHHPETDEIFEGPEYKIKTWPSEKTIIEWQNCKLDIEEGVKIVKYGDWQVFTETMPNIELRIGSILSLERIAQDSTIYDGGRDHIRGMEILCAYIRENSPVENAEVFQFPESWLPDSIKEKLAYMARPEDSKVYAPRSDVQLALSVIGRRTLAQRSVEQQLNDDSQITYRLNLSRTNLQFANMENCNFDHAIFFRSK